VPVNGMRWRIVRDVLQMAWRRRQPGLVVLVAVAAVVALVASVVGAASALAVYPFL